MLFYLITLSLILYHLISRIINPTSPLLQSNATFPISPHWYFTIWRNSESQDRFQVIVHLGGFISGGFCNTAPGEHLIPWPLSLKGAICKILDCWVSFPGWHAGFPGLDGEPNPPIQSAAKWVLRSAADTLHLWGLNTLVFWFGPDRCLHLSHSDLQNSS